MTGGLPQFRGGLPFLGLVMPGKFCNAFSGQ
jgi:hypothetical protein